MFVPVGAVTTIVPVGVVQVGCEVALAVGAAGAVGTGLITMLVAVLIHPVVVFLAVML
jgi:hypothetical protein